MTQSTYLWSPPPVYSLPVRGKQERLPINRLFFVGRNYHAHAVEMGRPVDKAKTQLFYFTKAASTLVESGATLRENNLVETETICQISSVLIANRSLFKLRHAEIAPLIEKLRTAIG